ncbi:MAG: hypothetical protein LQ341_005399 [Variospora aurantia]|nr:MAG: hypothetical protein LQ341_005399 [Variospora aurantia]
MDRLPPEMLDMVAQYLSNDKAGLKALRLATQKSSAAATKYLYRNIVLYTTNCSWEKVHAVINHPVLSHLVKTFEFSSKPYGTCISSRSGNCKAFPCQTKPIYLDQDMQLGNAISGITTLKFTGHVHAFVGEIAQINGFENVRKLDLDLSLNWNPLWVSPRRCDNSQDTSFITDTLQSIWLPKMKNSVRDISITRRPFFSNVNILWPFVDAGLSGLEKLSLNHSVAHPESLELLIRQQSNTLTSLQVLEPVIEPNEWKSIQPRLREMAPKLNVQIRHSGHPGS